VGVLNGGTTAEAFKWDGSEWKSQTIINCAGGCSPRAVFMISGGTGGDGWAVGTGGNIWRFQSGTWGLFTSPTVNQLNSVFISNPGNNLNAGWAVGNSGTVLRLQIVGGTPTWVVESVPGITDQPLYSVYFKDSNHGWIVGGCPTVGPPCATIVTTTDGGASWSGGTAQVVGAPATTVLRSVYVDTYGVGSGNGDGWAVGDDGIGDVIFAHWDGSAWTNTPLAPPVAASPTGTEQYSVFVRGPEDGFSVGKPVKGGTLSAIFHLDPLHPPTGGGTTVITTLTTQTSTTSTQMTTSSQTTTSTSETTSETSATSVTSTQTSEATTSIVTTTVTPTETMTSTSETTVQTTTSAVTTPLELPAIPGFPWESILAGIIIGFTTLAILRRRRS